MRPRTSLHKASLGHFLPNLTTTGLAIPGVRVALLKFLRKPGFASAVIVLLKVGEAYPVGEPRSKLMIEESLESIDSWSSA